LPDRKNRKEKNEKYHLHDDLSMDPIKLEMQNEQIKAGQQARAFWKYRLSSILANHYPITQSDDIKDAL
jgi:hypothetical protein